MAAPNVQSKSRTLAVQWDNNVYTDPARVPPQPDAPVPPTLGTPVQVNSTTLSIPISGGSGATSWTLQKSTDGGTTWSSAGAVTVGATQADATVTTGQSTQLRILASDGVDDEYSNVVTGTASAGGVVLFSDSFESGSFASAVNGFSWGVSNGGAIGGGIVQISTGRAFGSGTRSLMMAFNTTQGGYVDSWAEQRFGTPQTTELWVKFALYVPSNYNHLSTGGGVNNKFLAIYNGNYTTRFQVNFSTTPGPGGGSLLQLHVFHLGSELPKVNTGVTLIAESDKGKWMEVICRVKCATSEVAADGIMTIWKKADGADQYTMLYTRVGNMYASSPAYNYIDGGYILGWANAGYFERTELYIDAVEMALADAWGVI